MKQTKAFTLIELLIVMIIVATMVAIALPKYQRSLERGRALEGVRNVQYAAEYANAKHMACEIAGTGDCGYSKFSLPNTDRIKNRFFTVPAVNDSGAVTVTRNGGGWGYSLTATISGDVLQSITCSNSGSEDVCTELDMPSGVNLMSRN